MCFQFPCDIDQAIEYDLLLMASTGVMRKKTCKFSLILLSVWTLFLHHYKDYFDLLTPTPKPDYKPEKGEIAVFQDMVGGGGSQWPYTKV